MQPRQGTKNVQRFQDIIEGAMWAFRMLVPIPVLSLDGSMSCMREMFDFAPLNARFSKLRSVAFEVNDIERTPEVGGSRQMAQSSALFGMDIEKARMSLPERSVHHNSSSSDYPFTLDDRK